MLVGARSRGYNRNRVSGSDALRSTAASRLRGRSLVPPRRSTGGCFMNASAVPEPHDHGCPSWPVPPREDGDDASRLVARVERRKPVGRKVHHRRRAAAARIEGCPSLTGYGSLQPGSLVTVIEIDRSSVSEPVTRDGTCTFGCSGEAVGRDRGTPTSSGSRKLRAARARLRRCHKRR